MKKLLNSLMGGVSNTLPVSVSRTLLVLLTLVFGASEMRGQLNPCERTLPDGIYRIATVNNIDFNIGVEGNSEGENAYIKLYPRDINNESQLFLVEYLPNFHAESGGYNYRIKNVKSRMFLRPFGNSPWSESYDIVQSTNDQNGARWIIEDGGNGTYRIRSATGNYCLDLNRGNVASGEQIHTWAGSMGNTQQWVFVPVDGVTNFPNGDYNIRSAIPNAFGSGVDLIGGSTAESTKIHLWSNLGQQSQKWHVEYVGNGYYKILSKPSGDNNLALNVKGNDYFGNPDVQLYAYNGNDDASQWVLRDAGNGSFYIINKRGLFLDVASAGTKDGTAIKAYRGNSTDAQKWYFVPVDGEQTISDGIYQIVSNMNRQYVVDYAPGHSDRVHLWETQGTQFANQRWRATWIGGGYYTFQSLNADNTYLSMKDGSHALGTNVETQSSLDDASKFVVRSMGDGSFNIIHKNGLFVDVVNGTMANGTNIQGWQGNSAPAQKFVFKAVDGTKTIEDGWYTIDCQSESKNLCLTVLDSKKNEDRANVQLGEKTSANNQIWKVTYLENDGYYSIMSAGSGKAIDVADGRADQGTNIQQFKNKDHRGEPTQQWIIKSAGDDSYYIYNYNGLYLDVSGGKLESGANIQLWLGNQSDAQKFVFNPVTPNGPVKVIGNNGQEDDCPTVNYAISRANDLGGGTIKILEDVNVEGSDVNEKTLIRKDSHVTIDLNGHSFLVNGKSLPTDESIDASSANVTILLKDDGFTSYTNECQVTGSPVKYVRDLPTTTRAGKWQALYLPFKAEAPSGYEFGSPKRGSVSQSSAKLVFEKGVTSLEAKKYYFVRSSDGKVTITQQNATLLPYTTPEQEAYAEGSNLGIKGSLHNDDNVANADKTFWVLTNGGKFTWAKAGSHQRPYHWVIYVPNNSIAALNLFEEEDDPTAVESVESVEDEDTPIYTIGGIRVNSSNLAPGIYVRGGKKFVVR